MSIKKQYLKTKPVCKVTFSYPNESKASSIQLLGDFNSWDIGCEPMKKNKSGKYSKTIELETGKEYQFRYLVNGDDWQNDPTAEKYEVNEFATENSVVVL